MALKGKKICDGKIENIFKYCENPKVCFPRAIPIKNQQPTFFSGSGNNPQFILTQAGKYSFLANPVASSSKRTTIFVNPPKLVAPQLISNNLY